MNDLKAASKPLAGRVSSAPAAQPPPAQDGPAASENKQREPDYKLWQRCHEQRATVRLTLLNGQTIEGTVLQWGYFSVALQVGSQVKVVFKHSISIAEGLYP